ncbi:hypothetical protein [Amycolatopsis magusensis]|uniref:hypothetical protein n=1 Tax=Amycolatopsis magusensis TaxID=882444 RepID=UPI0037B4E42F
MLMQYWTVLAIPAFAVIKYALTMLMSFYIVRRTNDTKGLRDLAELVYPPRRLRPRLARGRRRS